MEKVTYRDATKNSYKPLFLPSDELEAGPDDENVADCLLPSSYEPETLPEFALVILISIREHLYNGIFP